MFGFRLLCACCVHGIKYVHCGTYTRAQSIVWRSISMQSKNFVKLFNAKMKILSLKSCTGASERGRMTRTPVETRRFCAKFALEKFSVHLCQFNFFPQINLWVSLYTAEKAVCTTYLHWKFNPKCMSRLTHARTHSGICNMHDLAPTHTGRNWNCARAIIMISLVVVSSNSSSSESSSVLEPKTISHNPIHAKM